MEKLKVVTIYPAYMGEINSYGIGAPCTFVRLGACNLRCYKKTLGCLCDTPEALTGKDCPEMEVSEVVKRVVSTRRKLVCLTGGEPLLQKEGVIELIKLLDKEKIAVCIETNGSKSIAPFIGSRNVRFIMDYKLPSTGQEDAMLLSNFELLGNFDCIKFVVYDMEDFQRFVNVYKGLKEVKTKGLISVGLFWGTPHLQYTDLYRLLERSELNKVYVNIQAHKLCCLADKYNKELPQIIVPKDL